MPGPAPDVASVARTYRLVIPAVFALDRASKWWARRWLEARSPVEVATFFRLTYLENTGAAFGLMHGANALLMLVSVGLLAALVVMSRRWPARDRLSHCGIALVMGGALGNLYDRLLYGYVVDFLDFRVWPVFNVADSCITVGASVLALGLQWRRDAGGAEGSGPA